MTRTSMPVRARRIERENALDAFAVGDLPHGEGRVQAAFLRRSPRLRRPACASRVAFDHLHADLHGVARTEFRDLVGGGRLRDLASSIFFNVDMFVFLFFNSFGARRQISFGLQFLGAAQKIGRRRDFVTASAWDSARPGSSRGDRRAAPPAPVGPANRRARVMGIFQQSPLETLFLQVASAPDHAGQHPTQASIRAIAAGSPRKHEIAEADLDQILPRSPARPTLRIGRRHHQSRPAAKSCTSA